MVNYETIESKTMGFMGQTNALYTQWCSEHNGNYYRYLILYVLDGNESITQNRFPIAQDYPDRQFHPLCRV